MLIALLLLAAPNLEIEYESYVPPKYEVFVFLNTKCPLARLYAGRLREFADRYPQVHFQGVSANEQDSDADIADFQKGLRFGFRKNPELIERFGATQSPEAFFLVNDKLVYQGRIDDQYTPGANRSQPGRNDLEEAINDILSGRPVAVATTKATGCHISVAGPTGGDVTFEHIAPILHKRCAECHRTGAVAPFSLLTHKDALGWKNMIKEVVQTKRMPPWHADPNHGKFANDRSLTEDEKELLVRWVDAGAPAGEREPEIPHFSSGWLIRPDVVLTMPSPFTVPPEGVLDYQDFPLNPGFEKDTWVQGIQIRPGNNQVVHHVNVFLRPKGAPAETVFYNSMEDLFFAVMVPGNTTTAWPQGIAKLVPAGWDIVLAIHYQPNGSPQVDQTSIALELADLKTVRKQIATRAMLSSDFALPPHQITTLTNTWALEDDFTLHALMPHMHLRGKSMRVEADGEVLLNVPKFDFGWQHRYVFAEPKRLKKGAVIVCTAEFDNTDQNPNNPDPTSTVRVGKQSTDEMFQLNLDITKTTEDRLAKKWQFPTSAIAALFATVVFCFFRGR